MCYLATQMTHLITKEKEKRKTKHERQSFQRTALWQDYRLGKEYVCRMQEQGSENAE